MSIPVLLLSSFLIAVTALLIFIWSLRKGLMDPDPAAARVIFAPGELGTAEEPSLAADRLHGLQQVLHAAPATRPSSSELQVRLAADRSTALPAFVMLGCAVVWLLFASLAGLTSSLKLHDPDWLNGYAWLSFGRIRTLHLNAVAYGWAPMAALGIALWMLPRLLRTELVGARYAVVGALLWNLTLVAGLVGIALGINAGMEWLEIPWQIGGLFALAGALIGVPMVLTLRRRQVEHLYVSVWYIGAALFWFPVLYLVAKWPGLHFGVEAATMNWWFGHNVLGLFYTPLSLAAVYYFLPKVIGKPVRSYNLSLVGFWCLAFFYGQVGGHHLIGGPVPEWLVTLSIVQSMMMIVPVLAFSVNQHQTLRGHFAALWHSPTLRFVVLGGMMYTLSSVQGSLEALRSVNTVTHFTHFTVAHAHLGLYGFVTLVLFGAMYFAMPRILRREWPYPKLIAAHFWLVVVGFAIYFVTLTIGGWLQGLAMLDASRPFMDSVRVTLPWLQGRSLGGALMTFGHIVFALHFAAMALGFGPQRREAAQFHPIAQAA
jgi:cytochrome c oxidase cbb3-type subunit 1